MALYKRGKTWWMNFWFDGTHIQRSTRCKSKRDAETVERAYYTQLAKAEVGFKPKVPIPNFKVAVRDFVAWSKVEHASKPNTWIRYETSTVPLIRFFGDVRVDRISSRDVEKYKIWRSAQKQQPRGKKPKDGRNQRTKPVESKTVAPATVNRELACLKRMLNRLVNDDILMTNPVSKVKLFNEDNRQTRVLSYAEEKTYLMACSQPLRDFAIVMLETGMRPDEVRRLTADDVFIEKGYLQVRGGKTKAARRRIPLTERVSKVLEARMEKAKGDYLFPRERGTGKNLTPIIKPNKAHYAAVARCGVTKFRLYDLRHTFATRQVESGTDLVTLAALLGHSRLEMVMRYAHPSEDHKIEAIRRMEGTRPGPQRSAMTKAA